MKTIINFFKNLANITENKAANAIDGIITSGKASTRKATISARVFRKAENKWYDLGVIAKPEVSINKKEFI